MTTTLSITEAVGSTLQVPFSEAGTLEIVAVDPVGPFVPAPSVNLLIDEGFEGVGAPSGWSTDFGTPNYDYSTAPLVGAQSLLLDMAIVQYETLDNAELWLAFRCKFGSVDATSLGSLNCDVTSGNGLFFYLYPDGKLAISDNYGVESVSVDALVEETVYDFFIHFKKGTGSDGIGELSFVEAGGTRPTDGSTYVNFNNGAYATNIILFSFQSDAFPIVLDAVKLSDEGWPTLPALEEATTYLFSGPAGGNVGEASSDFTVELPSNAPTVPAPVTITPDDGSDGSFTPTSVELTTAAPSATFTYTPASIGAKAISVANDGGLTNPANLAYAVSATGLSDGDPVDTWPDSSGNGHDAAMTGGSRPIFKTAIVNSKPVVRFTSAGTSGLNIASAISGTAPWTILVVMKPATVTSDMFSLVNNTTVNPSGPLQFSAGTRLYCGDHAGLYPAVITGYSAFHVFRLHMGVSGPTINTVDGSTVTMGALVPNANAGDFESIGHVGAANYSNGDIAELIIYNTDVSHGTDGPNLDKYLGTKYGISVAGGSAVQPDTVTGLVAWWKADAL